MKAKAYKVELLVIDLENLNEDDVKYFLENVKYLYPMVKSIQSREIGEWSDDHPLNLVDTHDQAYKDLFEEPK
jgi:hypothetical protein